MNLNVLHGCKFTYRRYTKFYGTHGDAAAKIAHDAILGNLLCFLSTLVGSVSIFFLVYSFGHKHFGNVTE